MRNGIYLQIISLRADLRKQGNPPRLFRRSLSKISIVDRFTTSMAGNGRAVVKTNEV
jgi:hypothetical protein